MMWSRVECDFEVFGVVYLERMEVVADESEEGEVVDSPDEGVVREGKHLSAFKSVVDLLSGVAFWKFVSSALFWRRTPPFFNHQSFLRVISRYQACLLCLFV